MRRAVALLSGLLTSAQAEPAVASRCVQRCHNFGVCHEPTGRCDCARGYGGDDCSARLAPACALEGTVGNRSAKLDTGCQSTFASCACNAQCEAAGHLSYNAERCLATQAVPAGASLSALLAAPLVYYAAKEVVEEGIINTRAHPHPRAGQAAEPDAGNMLQPLDACPASCTLAGLCVKDAWGTHCACLHGFEGGSCGTAVIETLCVNQCSGHGRCKDGWCHCHAGWFGADCSLVYRDGREALFWEAAGALPSELRPRIYVYDLPPRFNTWWRIRDGIGRNTGLMLHERLLASRYRTANASEADFFYLPVAPMGEQNHYNAVRAARWVSEQYPFWGRRNGSDHLVAWPWDYGGCWVGGHPLLQNAIFLSHFGLTVKDRDYACDCLLCAPSYTPGKDVVLPDTFELPHKQRAQLLAGNPFRARPTLLFFAGSASGPSRRALFAANLTAPDVRLVEGMVSDLASEMASSVFCVAAPGSGFGTRAVLAIAAGCIPVSFVDDVLEAFEDVFDYAAFGVRIPQAALGEMVTRLRALPPAVVAAKQAALRCVSRHFLWTSISGRLGDEGDGSQDAFETLMFSLRRRLGAQPPWPLVGACEGIPGAPPLLRQLLPFGQGRRPWPPGGAACGADFVRPC